MVNCINFLSWLPQKEQQSNVTYLCHVLQIEYDERRKKNARTSNGNVDIDFVCLCQLYMYSDDDIHRPDFFEHFVGKNPYNHHKISHRNVCLGNRFKSRRKKTHRCDLPVARSPQTTQSTRDKYKN